MGQKQCSQLLTLLYAYLTNIILAAIIFKIIGAKMMFVKQFCGKHGKWRKVALM